MLGLTAIPAVADVQYVYDEIGRLVQVVDQNGESARYVYDAAGNIVQIVRIPAGTLAVTSFAPKSGPVGTAVTIYGSGFSTTPANNAVQFNGVSATVTNATANELVATVPSGATTGAIAVTVGAQTATSADTFVVTSGTEGAPTIAGFTPGGGAPGTPVTISGTNFDPIAANDAVRFNDAGQASLSSVTDTQITAAVPSYAGSGPISVRTPAGIAISAEDFVVPPPGYVYADIVSRTRIAIDGASGSLAIGTANKHGMALFNAAAGDYLSLQVSSLTVSPTGSISYKVFDPKNFQIASGSIANSAMSIHLPALTAAGTYSIYFSPGAATASLTFSLARNAVLSPAQPTVNSTIAVAGQSTRVVYPGTAGTSMGFRLGVVFTTPANQSVSMTLYKDAMQIATASGSSSAGGAAIPPFSLPVTGSYFVVVTPSNAATGAVSVTLSAAIDLVIDGAPLAVSTSTAGGGKRVLFSATAGQQIGLALTGLTYSPSSGSGTTFAVYNPNGSQLASSTTSCLPSNPGGGCTAGSLGVLNLASTGTYQVVLTPPSNVTLSGTLTASSSAWVPTLSSGSPSTINITRAGQWGGGGFSGTAGQAVTVRLDVASTTPANQTVTMTLWGASGQVGQTVTATQGSDGGVLYATLPSAGGYSVILSPSFGATGSMSLTLNPGMDLATNGAPLNVSTSVAGRPRRVLFSATAGQQIGLALTGLTYSPSSGSGTTFAVYNPNGSQLASSTTSCLPSNPGGGCTAGSLGVLNLPSTGTYQVVLTPPSNVTLSGTLTASSSAWVPTLSSGSPSTINITRAGQWGGGGFSGTAGQAVTLRLDVASTTPANQTVTMTVWGPSGQVGSAVTATQGSDGGVFSATLPSAGGYSVILSPSFGATGSMSLTLNPGMNLAIDGAPLNVSTSVAGRPRRLLFSATAGQQIGLALTGLTYSPSSASATTLAVYAPNGTLVASSSGCLPSNPGGGCTVGASGVLNLPALTGTYQIVVTPPSNVTFSGTLTASSPTWGTLTSGTPSSINLTRAGQWGGGGFSGTAGKAMTLRLDVASTTPANQTVSMQVWGASGQVGSTVSTTQSGGPAFLNATLPSTGGYSVIVSSGFGATGSMTVLLNLAP